MKKSITNMLIVLCLILAGINIYLLVDKDRGKNDSLSPTEEPLKISSTEGTLEEKEPIGSLKAVDLGLSVYWASCNLGAESPEAYGSFYRWGETDGVAESEHEDWDAYKYCDGKESCASYNLGENISRTNYDVAYLETHREWRMPTADEIEELLHSCNCTWGRYRGTEGIWVGSPNGNTIFLPRVGKHKEVQYWSSTQNPNKNEEAYTLGGSSGNVPTIQSVDRCYTLHIRPVKDK